MINISPVLTLYRADNKLTPEDWDNDFKNDTYIYPDIGEKNNASLLFFYDSIDMARYIGKTNCISNNEDVYYLTECQTINDIYIIDFSYCIHLNQMIYVLADLEIDVFTNSFKTYEEQDGKHMKTFQKFRGEYEYYLKNKKGFSIIPSFSDSGYSHDPIGTFGQRLTDFDNGIEFLNVIRESDRSIDGYRWKESEDPRGFTYCLFTSDKISKPNKSSQNPRSISL